MNSEKYKNHYREGICILDYSTCPDLNKVLAWGRTIRLDPRKENLYDRQGWEKNCMQG